MLDFTAPTPLQTNQVSTAQIAPYDPFSTGSRSNGIGGVIDLFGKNENRKSLTTATKFENPVSIASGTAFVISKENKDAANTLTEEKGSELDNIAKQRTKLLAMKYSTKSVSHELIARLEILDQRINEHSPRVTKSQVEALEEAAAVIDGINKRKLERKARLASKLG